MASHILWSAVVWTFRGLLCTLRFCWVSPYDAVKLTPGVNHAIPKDLTYKGKLVSGSERKQNSIPGSHDRVIDLQKRLSQAEQEIQALRTQVTCERSLWEARFSELQRGQLALQSQMVLETLSRTGVVTKVGNNDNLSASAEKGPYDNKDFDSPTFLRHSNRFRASGLMSLNEDCPRSLSSSQLSLSSVLGSRPSSAMSAASSVGSWRSSPGPHRVFVPHSPLDLKLGHCVRVLLNSGRIGTGTIRYLGHLQGEPEFHLGVELRNPDPCQHNGTHGGRSFFQCEPGHGAFVPFNKLVMAWE